MNKKLRHRLSGPEKPRLTDMVSRRAWRDVTELSTRLTKSFLEGRYCWHRHRRARSDLVDTQEGERAPVKLDVQHERRVSAVLLPSLLILTPASVQHTLARSTQTKPSLNRTALVQRASAACKAHEGPALSARQQGIHRERVRERKMTYNPILALLRQPDPHWRALKVNTAIPTHLRHLRPICARPCRTHERALRSLFFFRKLRLQENVLLWVALPPAVVFLLARLFDAIALNPSGSLIDPIHASPCRKCKQVFALFLQSILFIPSARFVSSLLPRAHQPSSAESSSYVLHHLGSWIINPHLFESLTPHVRHARRVYTSFVSTVS